MDSKLKGLTIGEEYMIKPFDPRELLLRIQKMLGNQYGTFTQINHVFIDAEYKRVFINDLRNEVALQQLNVKYSSIYMKIEIEFYRKSTSMITYGNSKIEIKIS